MKKILELTEKEFLTGIAPSALVQDKGLWSDMHDTTVIRDTFVGDTDLGLLQAVAPNTTPDITFSDNPICYIPAISGSNDKAYFMGDAGHFYEYDISAGTSTDKRSGTPITNPANGLIIFQPRGGTRSLLYFQKSQIGKWDMSGSYPTGWTDNFYTTNMTNTSDHPTHKVFDQAFFGNGAYVGQIADDGAGGFSIDAHALDIQADEQVKCLSDDGVYLVIGTTSNTGTVASNMGRTRILFWDMSASSWSREWTIPEGQILAIRRVGAMMYAIGTRSIYAFTFNASPEPVLGPLAVADLPSYTNPHVGAAVIGDAIVWPQSTQIAAWGKLRPHLLRAYLKPFGNFPGQPTIIAPDIVTTALYVVVANGLYTTGLGSGSGASGDTVYAQTIFIDMKRWYQIGCLVVEFDGHLSGSQSVRFSLQNDRNNAAVVVGTATASTVGTIPLKEFYTSLEANTLRIKVEFLVGNVKIRRLAILGDPIERPTHTV